jgi:hypothetical protein
MTRPQPRAKRRLEELIARLFRTSYEGLRPNNWRPRRSGGVDGRACGKDPPRGVPRFGERCRSARQGAVASLRASGPLTSETPGLARKARVSSAPARTTAIRPQQRRDQHDDGYCPRSGSRHCMLLVASCRSLGSAAETPGSSGLQYLARTGAALPRSFERGSVALGFDVVRQLARSIFCDAIAAAYFPRFSVVSRKRPFPLGDGAAPASGCLLPLGRRAQREG